MWFMLVMFIITYIASEVIRGSMCPPRHARGGVVPKPEVPLGP